jgi:hypothetical protein
VARRQHGGEDGRRVVINRRDEEGKERGAAARSREVGEARHGKRGGCGLSRPGLWAAKC